MNREQLIEAIEEIIDDCKGEDENSDGELYTYVNEYTAACRIVDLLVSKQLINSNLVTGEPPK